VASGICKFATGPGMEELERACFSDVFESLPTSFVTSIYPFLLNRVQSISMNMAEGPRIETRFCF
jgi:hypothetical protein